MGGLVRTRRTVFLVCVAILVASAAAWWMSSLDPGNQAPGTNASASPTESPATAVDTGPALAGGNRNARRSVPNVVTRVGDRYVWELDEPTRQNFLADLRALAEAGWAEAVTVLAPVVVDCIDHPPQSEALMRSVVYGADIQVTFGEDGLISNDPPPAEESAEARAAKDEWFRQMMSQSREKQMTCNDAMPANPDRLMDWLELGLEQQPEGFVDAVLSGRLMPDDNAWIVRNAERLAAFNQRLIGIIESRVMQGDPEALARAWRVLARGNFTPEPEPLRAYPYALVARMLPGGTAGHVPGHSRTREQVEHLLDRPLTDAEIAAARDRARELYDRCCATSISR